MLDTIKIEAVGDLVKVAQYMAGYAGMKKATDYFDDSFTSHIMQWQAQHGLAADGVIGPKTWAAIASAAPTCTTSKNAKSAYTCAIQILVGGLDVDGIYGPKTKAAVAAYQSANKLAVDGKCGPKTWASLIGVTSDSGSSSSGSSAGQTVSNGKVINNCVHYLQWDSKWKNIKYSTHTSAQTIGNSGCGPTAMAQIIATFIDPKITPVEMCKLAVDNGYRTENSGTKWGFFQFVFNKYSGFSKFLPTSSVPTLKAALKEGALAVCSVNGNDGHFWTTQG